MAQDSKIQWTDSTFNHVRGCSKVSPGCANCYADAMSGRNPGVLGVWGPQGTRVVASESYWREPLAWERRARDAGVRHRVFCASLADVFEGRETMPEASWAPVAAARARLFRLILDTPHLDWLLLTKRPHNVRPHYGAPDMPAGLADDPPPNVWLGASVEDQQRAEERIPRLLDAPARLRFLSCEPLLGPLDLTPWLPMFRCPECGGPDCDHYAPRRKYGEGVDWVIVGGESGRGARPFDLTWCEEVVNQCAASGVPCFVKQLGSRPCDEGQLIQVGGVKGDDLADWPEHLRVRRFPWRIF